MKQSWHTKGYIKLSHALLYIGMCLNAGFITAEEAGPTIDILVKAGRAIRREQELS